MGILRRKVDDIWLQWGRTREGAEGEFFRSSEARKSLLQWGRTREGAEGR